MLISTNGIMARQNMTYTPPQARKAQSFSIYPIDKTKDTKIGLQSDNYCIIVQFKSKTMLISKRISQYPRFAHCLPENGGKRLDLPKSISNWLVDEGYLTRQQDGTLTLS